MAASKIDTKKIRTDLGTQSRVDINEELVREYTELMERGEEFPPIKVYYDMEKDIFILVDGFHRFLAWLRAFPNDPIHAEQVLGTVTEAVWESFAVNKTHGLRRTNADKRKAVEGALRHQKCLDEKLSGRAIAKHCGVGESLVRRIHQEIASGALKAHLNTEAATASGALKAHLDASDEPEYRTGLDGKKYSIKPRTVIGTDGIEYPVPAGKPDRLPWENDEPDPTANTHENFTARLAECSGRKRNEFKRNYDVPTLRCSKCSLYQDIDGNGTMGCINTDEPRAPDALICDYFDYVEPYVPQAPKPVENRPLDGGYLPEDKSGKLRRTYGTYERRNCIEIKLPKADPQYFVQVLLLNFERDYLATILPILHQRLLEKDDDD